MTKFREAVAELVFEIGHAMRIHRFLGWISRKLKRFDYE